MKDIFKFILFISYTILIFFVSDWRLLFGILAINIIMMFLAKVNIRKSLINLLGISIFIIFAMSVNFAMLNLREAVLIGVRLVLVCNITYTFSRTMSVMKMATVIEKLMTPVRFLGTDGKDISILICISISFIPILKDEFTQILYSLKAKSVNIGFTNLPLVFESLFYTTLKRTNDIELSLRAKGYGE